MEIHPQSAFQQVSITLPKEHVPEMEEFLLKAGALGCYEVLYQEGISNLASDETQMVFFFPIDLPATAIVTLTCQLLGIEDTGVEHEIIRYADYIKMFEDSFKAFALTQTFWLVPPWDTTNPEIPAGARRLYLKPGLAFGTGRHATTRLMVSFLEQHLPAGAQVLDLGTGSGILAIAAAILGASQVQGVDVERLAVDSARENFALNQTQYPEIRAQFFQGDFSFHRNPQCPKRIDVFLANILPNIFYQNRSDLFFYLQQSPRWALSGIPAQQKDEFANFLTHGGFRFEVTYLEDWLMFYCN